MYYVVEVTEMDIREMRIKLGDTQSAFAARYHIPFRTIQNWEAGVRKPPEYVMELLNRQVAEDLVNRKTVHLPEHDSKKQSLPKMRDYRTSLDWLRAVRDCMEEPVVFALDEALMCHGLFLGRDDEYLVWVYGSDALSRFDGVVMHSPPDVIEAVAKHRAGETATLEIDDCGSASWDLAV